ncbi:MAG: amidohydrolase [Deltaproteobacteria bacterium]|nr:amidohydrolase [Deltaproteobacteria bacterium]
MKKIDFEAHFYTRDYLNALYENSGFPRFVEDNENGSRFLWYAAEVSQPFAGPLLDSLLDHSDGRLKRMDASGIDMQVLSLSAPGLEQLDPDTGTVLAKKTNDYLAKIIQAHPDRFMGYAALAPKNPNRAADELERCVKDLGFIAWNTHANYGDSYLDARTYRPILERAEKLNVPIYIHPTVSAVTQLKEYGFPLAGTPFGFGYETAMCLMRMIYNGIFDEYPRLKIILGHLGEGLPFIMERIDWTMVRPFDPELRPKIKKKPSDYLRENVLITTSGNYYEPAFRCALEAMGVDRILLGTDYPYEETDDCMQFLAKISLSEEEKEKLYHLNAKRIGIVE